MSIRRGTISMEGMALAAICAGYVGWVLSLPLFPTQDGPMHLYYVHVMSALFSQSPGSYGEFYRIKHLLPPYSAYYYLLIGLSKIVPLFLADKLIICGYIVAFVYGFRYLARAIGPAADGATLLVTLVVLNWSLCMGFVNYCLGIALALWILGVWVRAVGKPELPPKVLFVALCALLVLVHPVPLLVVIAYCAIDLVTRRWRKRDGLAVTRADAVCLFLAMLTLGYIKLFTVSYLTQHADAAGQSFAQEAIGNLSHYVRGRGMSLFNRFRDTPSAAMRFYRLLIVAIVPFGLALAIREAAQKPVGGRFRGTLWLWLTGALIVAEPFVPLEVNTSHFFSTRLLVLVWVGALLAMSAYTGLELRARAALVTTALLGMIALVAAADGQFRKAATEMAQVERLPIEHRGELGLTLIDWRSNNGMHTDLDFNPYLWSSLHYFRHNDAVLYNTPWMDQTWIPLGARDGLATGVFSPHQVEDPRLLRTALEDAPSKAAAVSAVRFVVENHAGAADLPGTDPLLPGWSCAEDHGWYAVCVMGRGLLSRR